MTRVLLFMLECFAWLASMIIWLTRVFDIGKADTVKRVERQRRWAPSLSVSGVIMRRIAAALAIVGLTAATPLSCGVAAAITPPVVDPGAVPPDTAPAPDEPLRQEKTCAVTGVLPGTDLGAQSPSQGFMDIPALWKSAGRGAGVSVGIIDTGVNPSDRLPHLRGDGDYVVPDANGLSDCDSHGTIIASIIGGAPSEADGFHRNRSRRRTVLDPSELGGMGAGQPASR